MDENPFCNPKKNSEPAALAADWPIELRFQRKTAALAALQDPHHSIVATLRVAHRWSDSIAAGASGSSYRPEGAAQ